MTTETPFPNDPDDQHSANDDLFSSINNFLNLKKSEPRVEFPQKRIELVATETLKSLDALITSISPDELNESNEDEDILTSFYLNDLFVRNKITASVSELMQRTTQLVYLSDNESIGYCYTPGSEDGELQKGIYLLLEEDNLEKNFAPIYMPDQVQEVWDMSLDFVRDDMIAFAAFSKGDIISRFYDFARQYANPKSE